MSTNPFSETPPPGYQASQARQRVGFGPRLGAWCIDLLASILFTVLLSMIFVSTKVSATPEIQELMDSILEIYRTLGVPDEVSVMVSTWLPAFVLARIVASVAYSLIEGLSGASPGKRVLRLRIARADGSEASTQTYLSRWAVKNIASILNFVALAPALSFVDFIGSLLGFVIFVGCFFTLGESRQALHDLIAQTAVFSSEKGV